MDVSVDDGEGIRTLPKEQLGTQKICDMIGRKARVLEMMIKSEMSA